MLPENRIPTTHVGSLVRPPELLRTITAIEAGVAVDRAAFDAQLRRSVAEVVTRQKKAGIDIDPVGEARSALCRRPARLSPIVGRLGSGGPNRMAFSCSAITSSGEPIRHRRP